MNKKSLIGLKFKWRRMNQIGNWIHITRRSSGLASFTEPKSLMLCAQVLADIFFFPHPNNIIPRGYTRYLGASRHFSLDLWPPFIFFTVCAELPASSEIVKMSFGPPGVFPIRATLHTAAFLFAIASNKSQLGRRHGGRR